MVTADVEAATTELQHCRVEPGFAGEGQDWPGWMGREFKEEEEEEEEGEPRPRSWRGLREADWWEGD